jgi:hypothetical protein
MVTLLPATVSVPVRATEVLVTVKVTVPFPCLTAVAPATVIHAALLVAVQPHAELVVTFT